jgi:hypothetical protein
VRTLSRRWVTMGVEGASWLQQLQLQSTSSPSVCCLACLHCPWRANVQGMRLQRQLTGRALSPYRRHAHDKACACRGNVQAGIVGPCCLALSDAPTRHGQRARTVSKMRRAWTTRTLGGYLPLSLTHSSSLCVFCGCLSLRGSCSRARTPECIVDELPKGRLGG